MLLALEEKVEDVAQLRIPVFGHSSIKFSQTIKQNKNPPRNFVIIQKFAFLLTATGKIDKI